MTKNGRAKRGPYRTRSAKMDLDMGLGEALARLQKINLQIHHGTDLEGLYKKERDLILAAMDRIRINLPIACYPEDTPEDLDGDGRVSFFEAAATTSCCRIRNTDKSKPKPKSRSRA